MSNLADLKIYLTHEKMVLTNDRGFRVEFDITTPGNGSVYRRARGNGIGARILHQLSPRLLAEPWRLKGGV